MFEKIGRYFTIEAYKSSYRSADYSEIVIWQTAWTTRLNNSYGESSGHATDVSLAEFCMEMFDGAKWQRQLYFNFIFGIEAQFLVW